MSAAYPIAGLAVIPDKPSELPHSTPIQSFESGAGLREILLASIKASNVSLITFDKKCSSELDSCCCSYTNTGLSSFGAMASIASFSQLRSEEHTSELQS